MPIRGVIVLRKGDRDSKLLPSPGSAQERERKDQVLARKKKTERKKGEDPWKRVVTSHLNLSFLPFTISGNTGSAKRRGNVPQRKNQIIEREVRVRARNSGSY